MPPTKLSLINPSDMTKEDLQTLNLLNIMKPNPREVRMKSAALEREERIKNAKKDIKDLEKIYEEEKLREGKKRQDGFSKLIKQVYSEIPTNYNFPPVPTKPIYPKISIKNYSIPENVVIGELNDEMFAGGKKSRKKRKTKQIRKTRKIKRNKKTKKRRH